MSNGTTKRILVVMPHYCNRDAENYNKSREIRSMSLVRSVSSFAQHAGHEQLFLDFASLSSAYANCSEERRCDIFICTTAGQHLLGDLDILDGMYHHVETDAHPRMLGYTCREVLRSFAGSYDYYCYVEDDLFLTDPLFFHKLEWFSAQAGNSCLLQPHRCEVSFSSYAKKCYIDGDIPPQNNPYYDYSLPGLSLQAFGAGFDFVPASNPHSGCFFLNAGQFEHWVRQPHFGDWDMSWVGPLESAASLGIMKCFSIYKPAWHNANFLEINHFGDAYLGMIGDSITPPEDSGTIRPNPRQLDPLKVSGSPSRMPLSFS